MLKFAQLSPAEEEKRDLGLDRAKLREDCEAAVELLSTDPEKAAQLLTALLEVPGPTARGLVWEN